MRLKMHDLGWEGASTGRGWRGVLDPKRERQACKLQKKEYMQRSYMMCCISRGPQLELID